jgi:predicted Rossmann-fold nucleotide-binding protein
MGREYWKPLLEFVHGMLLKEKTIDPGDVDRIIVTDSADEAVQAVTEVAVHRFGLTYGPRLKRRWLLWE